METGRTPVMGGVGGSSQLAGPLKPGRKWVGLKEKDEKPWLCPSVLPASNDHTVQARSQARAV